MDIRALEKSIHAIVAPLVTPTPVIIENQDAPAPTSAYLTLGLDNARQIGTPHVSKINISNDSITVDMLYSIDLGIGGLKSTTKSDIYKLAAHLQASPAAISALESIGFGLSNSVIIRDKPVIIQGRIEERVEFVLALNYVDRYVITSEYFDRVSGGYKIKNETGDLDYNHNTGLVYADTFDIDLTP